MKLSMFTKKVVLLTVSVTLHRAHAELATGHGHDFGFEKKSMSGFRSPGCSREWLSVICELSVSSESLQKNRAVAEEKIGRRERHVENRKSDR